MAVQAFSAKFYNHFYKKEGYFRSYNIENASTGVISLLYGGQYSGAPKSIFPPILVSETYGLPTGATHIEQLDALNGFCMKYKIISYETVTNPVDVYFVIFREENFYYRLYTYTTAEDGTIISINTVRGASSWNAVYTQLQDYLYFYLINNGTTLSSSFTPQCNYYFTVNDGDALTTAQRASYLGTSNSQYLISNIITEDLPDPIDPKDNTDPYFFGGTSTTGGGGGTFSIESDPIDFPQLPSVSAVSTGFLTVYNPSLQQLQDLADYMWNTPFDINALKKLFNNPMDCIIGISMMPITIPETGAQEITIGNLISTVRANVASNQFVILDCGSIEINEYWGSYLDYSPYTKIELYLPFVGNIQISPDEVMNKTIQIKYYIDILDGAFVCFVKCGESILYNFNGSCASMIPITGNSWNELYSNILNAIGGLAVAGATGVVAGAVESASISATGDTAISEQIENSFIGTNGGTGAATVGAVMGSKPSIQKSNISGGAVGLLGIKKPYLTITMPRQCLPVDLNKISGYPSYITKKIGDLSGYTQVQDIRITGINATIGEINEITMLLTKGVIL